MAPEGGFSALAATPAPEPQLIAGIERPLLQDASATAAADPPIARILVYDTRTDNPVAEYGYPLGDTNASVVPQPTSSLPPAAVDNRLKELTAVDGHGTALVLELSFAEGTGTYRLYETVFGATGDNGPSAALPEPVDKHLIVDFGARGYPDRDYQAMTLGPKLADGRDSLILVSDNNFAEGVPTEFLVLAVRFDEAPQ